MASLRRRDVGKRSAARSPGARASRDERSKTFKLGPLTIRVRQVGTVPGYRGAPTYSYRVHVRSPSGASYSTSAAGSVHNYERKKLDFDAIGAMVADSLALAKSDSEEFLRMTGPKGRPAVRASERFSWGELQEAMEEAERRGLR